jgi:glycosyltransferase involved in cell wall biosynthesis
MQPAAAVVVATWNRALYLDRLLDALAAQQDAPPFEVVVIDNGSSDSTPEVIRRRMKDFEFPIRHLHEPVNIGPAAARNRGWQATSAPIIAFTDDDCMPSPGWLGTLTTALDAGADVAQGRTEPAFAQRPQRGPFSMTMEKRSEDGFYETCNIAYQRELLVRLDGFDAAFAGFYAEDVDLGWRARKAGAITTFVDDAVVEHEIWPYRWKSRLGDIRRREGMNVLLRKHPELRSLFPSPWFQKQTHPRAVAAAAALIPLALNPRSRARWITAAVAMRVYYSAVKPERANVRRRDWPWVLPLCLASDLADVASLARGSVRQGALFL